MKRLTKAQSELIDAFLAEHAAHISTAQVEKDFLISEVFSAFTEPVVYREHEAKFVLCGGTAVSKAEVCILITFMGGTSGDHVLLAVQRGPSAEFHEPLARVPAVPVLELNADKLSPAERGSFKRTAAACKRVEH